MSQTVLAANGTTKPLVVRTCSDSVPSQVATRTCFQRKPFVGGRIMQRQATHARALRRSHVVCITKVGETDFQTEVLKVRLSPIKACRAAGLILNNWITFPQGLSPQSISLIEACCAE